MDVVPLASRVRVVQLIAQPLAVPLGNTLYNTLGMLFFSCKVPAVPRFLGLNIFAPVNLKHYQNCLGVVVCLLILCVCVCVNIN